MHDDVANDVRSEPFRAGESVVLRSLHTLGSHGRAVAFAVAGRVLVDDDDVAVVASPLGSAVRRRAGTGSGPNARLVLPSDWDGSYVEDSWFGATVVRVHPRGAAWSVWRWHDGTQWLPDWYVNLELPWVRTSVGFDSQDWTLDVIATRDDAGRWSIRNKDEDELAFYTDEGLVTEADRAMIERTGEDATAAVHAGSFPFETDWSRWVPDPNWSAPQVHAGWDAVR
ncbi:DUF402 domain-containing protein [Curtobacterium sp. VKM Ac-2861]|uniref:DUF402 domain-containing protein n=1 Tax=Curtobacterium sp. VKM Ac-2861 TaxID=2739016 RepID=UPI0015659311|nr:DUF402 domain-containing protein [Curtobacterium sp. VKM Ac-2861]